MWRYLILLLLAVSLVRADDVLLFANGETVPLTDAQLIVADTIFPVNVVSPANGSIVDRDSASLADPDVLLLQATIPLDFPDGTTLVFMANQTQPTINGQTNIILGSNTTSGGTAVLYFNPNSSFYAGNWTLFAMNANAVTNAVRNSIVMGSYNSSFYDTLSPDPSYFQTDSVVTNANLTSHGPETRAELASNYSAIVNAQITNSTGSNALNALPFTGTIWTASYLLTTLKGVGVWNDTLLSSVNFFYTPPAPYREFTVNGHMNVTSISLSPSTIFSFGYTTAACTVIDEDVSYAVLGAAVDFYRDGTFLGTNTTNTSGNASFSFQTNGTGNRLITCNVSDQPGIYYYRGAGPEQNATLTVNNQPPTFDAAIDDASNATSPTNEGDAVTFSTSATDPEGDNWYILVCNSPGTVGGSCTGTEFCRSSLVASGAVASCDANTSGLASQSYAWYAYPCDNNSACGNLDNSTSPFNVNHMPVAHPYITPSSPTISDNLTCIANVTDSDIGDTATETYTWYAQDEGAGAWSALGGQTSSTLAGAFYDSNDKLRCEVTPTDNHGFSGLSVNSSAVTIAQGTLTGSAALNESTVPRYYSATVTVSCAVANGDAESVTLVVQDDHTGGFAQSSTSPALVYVNVSSIPLGRLASTSSASYVVKIIGQSLGTYHFRTQCQAGDTAPGTANSASQLLQVVADTSAPVITSGPTAAPANTTATISWTTDDLADSTVSYGGTAALGSSVYDPSLTTTHAVLLNSLNATSGYYFNVTSCNADGYCTTQGTYTFSTGGPQSNATFKIGYCTGTFLERGPNPKPDTIVKGDVFEFYCESPNELRSRRPITITLTTNNKQLRKIFITPPTNTATQVLYP